jgi:hypothetical protein
MIGKSTFLAVAASAVLGLAMLSVTEASARGHGGGGGGGGHGGGGMHSFGGNGGGMRMAGGRHGGHEGHGHHYRHPNWHVRYHRPIWYGGVRTVGYTYGATRVAGPCTCLSKEYTQDGRVLFKDLCTNEAAINPPVVSPQQSSAIDAPVQQASNAVQYQSAPPNALPQVDPMTGQPK